MSAFRDIGPIPDPITWRAACICARDGEGRVLLQLRDDRPGIAAPGKWSFFGGAVEPGETLEEAARREFREETGIAIAADPLTPFARFASGVIAGGVVHVFLLPRVLRPEEVRLGEGAGFGFLTRAQVARYELIETMRKALLALPGF